MNPFDWVEEAAKQYRKLPPQTCGIAYTQSLRKPSEDIWYDRLGADVPAYIAKALSELGGDYVFFTVEQVLNLALNDCQTRPLSAVFNVCLGHWSIDNWSLVPSSCSWAGLPVLPNGAHSATIGEDKLASKLFARMAGFKTAEDWAKDPDATPSHFVKKPRMLGSSIGLEVIEYINSTHFDSISNEEMLEPFVPGSDATITLLHNPAIDRLDVLEALVVRHQSKIPNQSVWSKDKKSGGSQNSDLARSFHAVERRLADTCLKLCDLLGVRAACRLDFRLLDFPYPGKKISLEDVVFLEINPCPTLSPVSSFGRTVQHVFDSVPRQRDDQFASASAFAVACMLLSVNPK